MTSLSIQDKEIMEKLADKKLSKQEIFEAKYNLLGFFSLLLKLDQKQNPENYKKLG